VITDETQVWSTAKAEDLWVLDKLILSRRLGYTCGPVGTDVPRPAHYIVRPCVNALGLGIGTQKIFLTKSTDHLPAGHFWCEIFFGRHLSVDYHWGEQKLCVEGIKDPKNPCWKWDKWIRVSDRIPLPLV
jgi:hypothetical protein